MGPCLFWIAFLFYAFLTAYVVTALSTAGDEHLYLLDTQSLYADWDLDIRNNVAQRSRRRLSSVVSVQRSRIGSRTQKRPFKRS